ncbi:hypothetical protein J4558_09810 [Leptolyngbya sp. 15MV]|nr:hypothetical protein J4558_09810 [Leptolyngbya sp. 15MV]
MIVGLTHRDFEPEEKRLFSYPDIKGDPVESKHGALTAYLFGAKQANRHLLVSEASRSISTARLMRMGSKLVEGGHYIFDAMQRSEFLKREPAAAVFLVPVVGSLEFIRGSARWILALQDASPSQLKSMPMVLDRVKAVRDYRAASKKAATRALAHFPTQFEVTTIPQRPYLVVPKVSSERRDYVPIGWLEPPTLPTDLVQIVQDATLFDFAVVTSRAHMAWLAHIGGRLKSDFRYSIGLVYNTFPWPDATPAQRDRIEELAQAVLDARSAHPTSSLADLYDPDTMPANLRKAHRALDASVDRLYRKAPFESDRDRVEHLFGLYEKLVNPLSDAARQNRRTARKRARGKAE